MGVLPQRTITALTAELSTMTIENDARKIVQDNIKRLRDIGTYRGRRHAMGLPVRGQRTRTQISTARKLNKVDRKG
jgi:small subunit ribosomal protein S13